jgi:hypothetical protein
LSRPVDDDGPAEGELKAEEARDQDGGLVDRLSRWLGRLDSDLARIS